jgi:hypothetical protein
MGRHADQPWRARKASGQVLPPVELETQTQRPAIPAARFTLF